MADREVMAKLFEATTDDDTKVPEAVVKTIVKAACKSKNEAALRDMALPIARIANPACQVVGVSVNTQHMTEEEARAYLARVEAEMGLPATDPYRFGSAPLVAALAAI